jgi:glycosyltransferase involved in cell wall biosynthesis
VKIAHVITRLLKAGSEENTIATCVAQASAGNEVTLIHGNEWDESQRSKCGSAVATLEVSNLVHCVDLVRDLRAILELRALFLTMRPTVVHTHQSKAGIVGRIAARLAGVPVIIHGVHIVPFVNVGLLQRTMYLAAERLAARFTHGFINVSQGTRQSYLERGVGRPEQHFVAHSGFDVGRFQNATAPDNWRDIAGVPEGAERPPIVLMLAALEERKRHVVVLELFDRVIRRIPDVRLLLAGEGATRQAVESTVKQRNLSSNVRLLGFYPSPERLIALSDLTILTSMREGLPRVFVQSLAGGKPVITTDLPGVSEIITDGVNGIVTPGDDVLGAVDALSDLLLDKDRLRKMQAAAAATDVSSWRVDAMCKTMAEVYRELIKGPTPLEDRTCGR